MPEPLEFQTELRRRSQSWERADPKRALLERQRWDTWLVTLPGGTPHLVSLQRQHGAYVGSRDCAGFEYHDCPCAHLCTVRKAAYIHADDVAGERVRILDVDQERAGHHVERVRADGGEPTGRSRARDRRASPQGGVARLLISAKNHNTATGRAA